MNNYNLLRHWDLNHVNNSIMIYIIKSICWLIYLPIILFIIGSIIYLFYELFSILNDIFYSYRYNYNNIFWNIFHFWLPACLFALNTVILILVYIIIYIDNHNDINKYLSCKRYKIRAFRIIKDLTFDVGIPCIIIYSVILISIFFFWMHMSIKSNKFNRITIYKHPLKIDISTLKTEIFKYSFDYIFTIFNTLIAVISILLALETELMNNKIIGYFSIMIVPIISSMKFLQLWYSFKLPINSLTYYNWNEVFDIYSIL